MEKNNKVVGESNGRAAPSSHASGERGKPDPATDPLGPRGCQRRAGQERKRLVITAGVGSSRAWSWGSPEALLQPTPCTGCERSLSSWLSPQTFLPSQLQTTLPVFLSASFAPCRTSHSDPAAGVSFNPQQLALFYLVSKVQNCFAFLCLRHGSAWGTSLLLSSQRGCKPGVLGRERGNRTGLLASQRGGAYAPPG